MVGNRRGYVDHGALSKALGARDPRARRNAQAFTTPNTVSGPIQHGRSGELQIALDPASDLAQTPRGQLTRKSAAAAYRFQQHIPGGN